MTWRVFHCSKRVRQSLQHATTRVVVLQWVTVQRRRVRATRMKHDLGAGAMAEDHVGQLHICWPERPSLSAF